MNRMLAESIGAGGVEYDPLDGGLACVPIVGS